MLLIGGGDLGVSLGLTGFTRLPSSVDFHKMNWEVAEKTWDLTGVLHVHFDSAIERRSMLMFYFKQEATAVEQVLHLSHVSSKSHEFVRIMVISGTMLLLNLIRGIGLITGS